MRANSTRLYTKDLRGNGSFWFSKFCLLLLLLLSGVVSAQTVTSITPQCVTSNQLVTLTITGSSFTTGNNGSVVSIDGDFNNVIVPVSRTSTQLVVEIPASYLNTVGLVTVQVGNRSGNSYTWSTPRTITALRAPAASPVERCGTGQISITASGAPSGGSYNWYTSLTGGTSIYSGNTLTTTISTTTTYYVAMTSGGCESARTAVTATIKPIPQLSSSLSPAAVCSGAGFTYTATSATAGTTFSWTRAEVSGISNAASSGTTASVNETLVNTTPNPVSVTYRFTLTANGCTNTQDVTVVVNPRPQLSSGLTPAAVCSGDAFTYTPSSLTAGATFSWTRAAVNGISNAAASGTGSVNEILVNTTTAPINVTYAYTTTANGCSGEVQNVTVTIKPIPQLSSSLSPAAVCSGAGFTYTATSATAGTTFSWTRAEVSGISNVASSGTTASVNETLVNTTPNPVSVTYRFTLTANGCTNTQDVTVVVNPRPQLSSSLTPAAVCSGSAFTYTPASLTAGATFSWTRAAVSGISNAAATGTGSVNETLINTTTAPINVTYAYTTTANGCSNTENVVLTVDPLPDVTITPTGPLNFCEGNSVTLNAPSAPAGQTYGYEWFREGQTGVFSTTKSIEITESGTFTLTITTGKGCTRTSSPITIKVQTQAAATITYVGSNEFCQGGSVEFKAPLPPSGKEYSYQWLNNGNIILGATASTYVASVSGNYSVIVSYVDPDPALTCSRTSDAVTVTVLPQPVAVITSGNEAKCIGVNNTTTFTVAGDYSGGTPQWISSNGSFAIQNASYSNGKATATIVATGTGDADITLQTSNPASACNTAISSIRLTVNPLPEATITAGSTTTFCQGGSVVLSAPEGANYSYQWFNGGTQVGTGRQYTATTSGDYTVRVTNTVTNCSSTTATSTTVTVNPQPTVTASAPVSTKCVGDNNMTVFDLTGTATNGAPTWTAVSSTGTASVSNFSSPNSGNTQVTVTGIGTVTVRLTSHSDVTGCNDATRDVILTVNPYPTANAGADMELCVGNNNTTIFDRNATGSEGTVAWTVKSTSGLEVTNVAYPFQLNSFVEVKGVGSAVLTLTITKDGCSVSDDVIYTVKPRPVLDVVENKTYCNADAGAAINFGSSLSGTTYTWTSSVNVGFGTGGTGNIPAYTATNTGTAPVTTTVRVTGTVNGCAGPEQSFTVTVNPTPKLSSTLTPAAVCSETTFSYTPTSATSGATFSWTRAAVDGISNPAVTTPVTGGISETLVNTTTTDKTVRYIYTISANGCTNTQNVDVVVKPKPTPNFNLTEGQIFYSGDNNITLTGSPSGGTFSGTGVKSGVFSPCEAFKSAPTGATEMNVAITYTVTVNGCTNSITKNVKIKKSIYQVVVVANPHPFCQGENVNYKSYVYRDATIIYPYLVNEKGEPVDENGNLIPKGAGSFPVWNPNYPFPSGTPQLVKEQAFRYFQPIVVSGTPLSIDLFNYQWTKNETVNRKNDRWETDDAGLSSQDYYGVKVTSKTGALCDAALKDLMSYRVYSADLPNYNVSLAVSPVPMCQSGPVTITATLDGNFNYWAIADLNLQFILTRGSTTYTLNNLPYNGTNTVEFTYDPSTTSLGSFMDGDKIHINFTSDVDEFIANTKCAGKTVSNTVTIVVEQPATVTTDLTNTPIVKCEGETASFTASGTGTGLQFNWFKDPATAVTATADGRITIVNSTANNVTTSTLTIKDLAKGDAGMYYAELINTKTTACRTTASTTKQELIVNAMPDILSMVGGEYCPYNADGVELVLIGAEAGMTYELKDNAGNTLSTVTPTTSGDHSFGIYPAGTYSIRGTGEGTCVNESVATATITSTLIPTTDVGNLEFEWAADNTWKFTALESGLTSDTENFGANPTFVWYTKRVTEGEDAWKEFARTKENYVYLTNTDPEIEVKAEVYVAERCQMYTMVTGTAVPFPVELIEFNATKKGDNVVLNWSTAMEKDNTGFEIQVSENGKDYRKLDFVPTKNGNSSVKLSYSYTDTEKNKRLTRYYRLKQIDTNGTTAYYGPVSVRFGDFSESMTAYPNPFPGNIYLDIETETAGAMEVTLTDMTGRKLLTRIIEVEQGKGTYTLELEPTTPAGAYIVTTRKGGEMKYFRLIKQ